jgi:hypothetical protein
MGKSDKKAVKGDAKPVKAPKTAKADKPATEKVAAAVAAVPEKVSKTAKKVKEAIVPTPAPVSFLLSYLSMSEVNMVSLQKAKSSKKEAKAAPKPKEPETSSAESSESDSDDEKPAVKANGKATNGAVSTLILFPFTSIDTLFSGQGCRSSPDCHSLCRLRLRRV